MHGRFAPGDASASLVGAGRARKGMSAANTALCPARQLGTQLGAHQWRWGCAAVGHICGQQAEHPPSFMRLHIERASSNSAQQLLAGAKARQPASTAHIGAYGPCLERGPCPTHLRAFTLLVGTGMILPRLTKPMRDMASSVFTCRAHPRAARRSLTPAWHLLRWQLLLCPRRVHTARWRTIKAARRLSASRSA